MALSGTLHYVTSDLCVCFLRRMLLASDEMQPYDRARVFLDEDFTAVEKFTVS